MAIVPYRCERLQAAVRPRAGEPRAPDWFEGLAVQPHPGNVAESSLLSGQRSPPWSYAPSLDKQLLASGAVSGVQLEAVVLAGMRHRQTAAGARLGFMLADGTGMGKGRTLAAILTDNWRRQRTKAVWLSSSADLIHDARRDLRAIGWAEPPVVPIGDLGGEEGLLFGAYSWLTRAGRVDQLVSWLGGEHWEGCLLLDEAHLCKNASQASQAVITLQQRLPMARLVYASATAASEIGQMSYMIRMGLWGAGSCFGSHKQLSEHLEQAGLPGCEAIALAMKATGSCVSRFLSFEGAEFSLVVHALSPEQRAVYDAAARLWRTLAGCCPAGIAAQFWSAHQRFFRLVRPTRRLAASCAQVLTGFKLPSLVERTKQALAEGMSVVIGLTSTGEAAALRAPDQPNQLPLEVLRSAAAAIEAAGGRLPDSIELAGLPANPVDQLIELLAAGGIQVAELTGRRLAAGGRVEATRRFQRGELLVAVISGASSSGISLHAGREMQCTRRRLHLTLELAWSADQQLQFFGRTHRTDQLSAPRYELLSTDAPGEQRFVQAVAGRLEQLGALMRGGREATQAGRLIQSELDSSAAGGALYRLYSSIGMTAVGGRQELYKHIDCLAQSAVLRQHKVGREQARAMVSDLGLADRTGMISELSAGSLKLFLNRLLGLELDRQAVLWHWLCELAQAEPSSQPEQAGLLLDQTRQAERVTGQHGLAVLCYPTCQGGWLACGPLLSVWAGLGQAAALHQGLLQVRRGCWVDRAVAGVVLRPDGLPLLRGKPAAQQHLEFLAQHKPPEPTSQPADQPVPEQPSSLQRLIQLPEQPPPPAVSCQAPAD